MWFHKFRGYDSYLIGHEFSTSMIANSKVIGQNMEKYLQVQRRLNIVFRDSLQFFIFFLDSLIKSIAMSRQQNFYILYEIMRNLDSDATD